MQINESLCVLQFGSYGRSLRWCEICGI